MSANVCLLTAARVPAQEVTTQPEVSDVEFVKSLAVSGTLTQKTRDAVAELAKELTKLREQRLAPTPK